MAEGYFTEAGSLMKEGGLDPREVIIALRFQVFFKGFQLSRKMCRPGLVVQRAGKTIQWICINPLTPRSNLLFSLLSTIQFLYC